ncbi:zinc finger protein 474-like isoform X3 [Diabrotica virgifera virgifera]|uniref:C2HC/C3H-type domain-containing protein n=1 Tax=Diabrotica virgifera virgifera TaxID=50390 RepID=A0ABM5KUS8_DIAVI|nr:zinc finger protein 474-like isoform X3 [Diabrotica virgifera virgifera]
MPHKPKSRPFLVLPLLESDLLERASPNLLDMPTKNPGLHLFTKTFPSHKKRKDSDENKRPLTATLEKPTILDIRLIGKIDMSKIRKEFLNISNLCRLPILLKKSKNSKPHRPLSLPPPAIEKKKKAKDADDLSILSMGEEEESTQSVRVTGRHASKLKSINGKRTVKTCDDNNNNSSRTIRIPRRSPAALPSDNKPIGSAASDTKSTKLPQPCNSCGRSDQPERLHSHPVTPIAANSPKLLVKATVQKPVPLKYKSSKSKKEKSKKTPSPTRKPSLPSQNIVHSNPSSANMLAAKRLEIMKKMQEGNDSRASSSGKRTLTCYICGREYGTSSLKLHEPKCLEKWERENSSLPQHLRRKLPVRPSGAVSSEEWNELAWEASQANLVPCPNCGRTFYPDRLVVHQRSCKQLPQSEFRNSNQSLTNVVLPPNTVIPSNRPSSGQGPPTAECSICGKKFGIHSLKVHEKKCYKQWTEANNSSEKSPPPSKIKTSPPEKRIVDSKGDARNVKNTREAAWQNHLSQLVPCKNCGRTFNPDRVAIHEKSCKGS